MDDAVRAWNELPSLTATELKLLGTVEKTLLRRRTPTIRALERASQMTADRLGNIFARLFSKGLLRYSSPSKRSLALTFSGYDALALSELKDRLGLIMFSPSASKGKESDLHVGTTSLGEDLIMKFYRLGRVSFRSVMSKREMASHRLPWVLMSARAASLEANAYRHLEEASVEVPHLVAANRHVLVFKTVPGVLLQYVQHADLELAKKVFEQLRKMHEDAGMVHVDMSPFNVLVGDDGLVYLIDFPQWVLSSHTNAQEYLERDIRNILDFFKRRHVDIDSRELLAWANLTSDSE
ncbi:MAG TPA: RIO1 family regulatory kinase/ATPase [Thermoproteota archaeon]|nr:RIO1 family regulatory kinase/ATPase [Thermoproteota archaeon]